MEWQTITPDKKMDRIDHSLSRNLEGTGENGGIVESQECSSCIGVAPAYANGGFTPNDRKAETRGIERSHVITLERR